MAIRVIDRNETLMLKARDMVSLYLPGWSIEWDRGLRRFGVCKYATKTISISKHLTEVNPDQLFFDTVLHEIGHGIAGHAAGHGIEWKNAVRKLGGNPTRLVKVEASPEPKYKGSCRCNNNGYRAHRLSKRYKNGTCTKCGFTVAWVDTHTGLKITSSTRQIF